MHELEIAVYVRIAHCIKLFDDSTQYNPITPPAVLFDLKGRTAGQAFYQSNKLRFNNDLLLRYKHQFIEETVDHEVAHLLAHHINPDCQAHGDTWRWCMKVLGHTTAERCHDMVTNSARKVAKFAYSCDCGDTHRVGSKKHKKIQAGINYTCRKCKARLTRTP